MQNLSNTAIQDIQIIKDDSFNWNFQYQYYSGSSWYGVDLSEFTFARMQIRENELSTTSLIEFSSTGLTNTINLSNKANGQLIISGDISSLPVNEYRYDIELSNSELIRTIGQGRLIISNQISS